MTLSLHVLTDPDVDSDTVTQPALNITWNEKQSCLPGTGEPDGISSVSCSNYSAYLYFGTSNILLNKMYSLTTLDCVNIEKGMFKDMILLYVQHVFKLAYTFLKLLTSNFKKMETS